MLRRTMIYALILSISLLACSVTTPDGTIADVIEATPAVSNDATTNDTEAMNDVAGERDTTELNSGEDAVAATATAPPAATSTPAGDDGDNNGAPGGEDTATDAGDDAPPAPSPLADIPYSTASTGEEIELTLPDTEAWENQFGGGVNAGTGARSTWVQSASSHAFFDNNDLRFGSDIAAAAQGTAALNLGPDLFLIVYALDTEFAAAAATPLATLEEIVAGGDLSIVAAPAEATVAELPAAVVTRSGTSADGIEMTVTTYVLFSPTQVVTLSTYWPSDAYSYYRPVIDFLLDRFTILR